jgi:hypothetical protein
MNEQTNGAATQSFEDAIRAHLIENRQLLVQQAVSKAIATMGESMKYSAYDEAGKAVRAFFEKEVAPELVKYLNDQKEAIVARMTATLKELLDAGLKAQAEQWMKGVTSDNDYTRAETIMKMFGVQKSRY